MGYDGALDGGGNLDSPLLLHLADAQEGGADDGDDDARYEGKGSFVHQLAAVPLVGTSGVEGADDCRPDDETYKEAETCSEPDLSRDGSVSATLQLGS